MCQDTRAHTRRYVYIQYTYTDTSIHSLDPSRLHQTFKAASKNAQLPTKLVGSLPFPARSPDSVQFQLEETHGFNPRQRHWVGFGILNGLTRATGREIHIVVV